MPTDSWTVFRIDDTGNVFVVRDGLDKIEAEKLAQLFEARGHKQMYWVERSADSHTVAIDSPAP